MSRFSLNGKMGWGGGIGNVLGGAGLGGGGEGGSSRRTGSRAEGAVLEKKCRGGLRGRSDVRIYFHIFIYLILLQQWLT